MPQTVASILAEYPLLDIWQALVSLDETGFWPERKIPEWALRCGHALSTYPIGQPVMAEAYKHCAKQFASLAIKYAEERIALDEEIIP